MTMTPEEIVREYREAKSPMKQIGILADENACTKREIVRILLEAGEEVPGQFLRKKEEPARNGDSSFGAPRHLPPGEGRRCGAAEDGGAPPEEAAALPPPPKGAGEFQDGRETALTVVELLNSMGGEVDPEDPIRLTIRAAEDGEFVAISEACRLLPIFYSLEVREWRPTQGAGLLIIVRMEEAH